MRSFAEDNEGELGSGSEASAATVNSGRVTSTPASFFVSIDMTDAPPFVQRSTASSDAWPHRSFARSIVTPVEPAERARDGPVESAMPQSTVTPAQPTERARDGPVESATPQSTGTPAQPAERVRDGPFGLAIPQSTAPSTGAQDVHQQTHQAKLSAAELSQLMVKFFSSDTKIAS